MKPLKLVQISDIHFGGEHKEAVDAAVERIHAERPDDDQPDSATVGVTTRTAAVPCGREDARSRCEDRAPNRSSGERSATSSGATWR